MRPDEILYLMYHEIESPGRPLCQTEPGYVRYALSERDFGEQLEWLQQENIRGISVTQALAEGSAEAGATKNAQRVVITFDDGCASDLRVVAPLLRRTGFGATFYVTLGFLGQSGYLKPEQVRELSEQGFEVGCHSMTHAYLSDLDDAGLQREIVDAKKRLEELTGREVHHFSCPGGRWSAQVARVAKQGGYYSVATSRIGVNGHGSDRFQLARIAVMRGTSGAAFQNLVHGKRLRQLKWMDFARGASRRLLGNTLYDRVRRMALGRPD